MREITVKLDGRFYEMFQDIKEHQEKGTGKKTIGDADVIQTLIVGHWHTEIGVHKVPEKPIT
ncbi:hypothetical protein GCM10020331_066710 [Ectobacillus funiculus]